MTDKESTGAIAYIHTGVWITPSPSSTFVTYNALGLTSVFERVYLIVKKGQPDAVEDMLKSHFSIDKPHNLYIYRIPQIIPRTNILFFLLAYAFIFKRHKELKAVITRNLGFLPYLKAYRRKTGVPVYLESHDFFTNLGLRDDRITSIKKRNCKLENSCVPYLDGVICLQQAQANLYQRYFPMQQFPVFRTGIWKIYDTIESNSDYLAYIGSFDKHKGIELLLKALSLTTTKPRILFIGGKDKQEVDAMYAQAEAYGVRERVEVTGWVTKNELHRLLNKVRYGMVPVQETFFNTYITSPLKLFDYYSHGIPVIATDLPTTRELIAENETGFLYQGNGPAKLAEVIDCAYSSKIDYASMQQHVLACAKKLLWTERARAFRAYLENKA